MLKLIKLFSWFKSHWKLSLSIVAVLIVAFGAFQSGRANWWLKEHHKLEGKLEEQLKDQNLLYGEVERERAVRRLEKAEEKKERERLEARIREAKKESDKAKLELEKEKKKTVLLPPNELVLEIAGRIGDQLTLTDDSLYLFTRLGTERTLDRFKDGEFYLSRHNKQLKTIEDHETKATSFAISLAKCEKAEAKNLKGWDDCRETLATAIKDKDVIRKAIKASVFWATVKGVAGGGLAVFILDKIFGLF